MCLYSITFYVVSVALLTIQMKSEILCKRQEFIGFKFIFFTTNGTRVCCNEDPLSITILYKKISYLQKRPYIEIKSNCFSFKLISRKLSHFLKIERNLNELTKIKYLACKNIL